MTLLAAGLRKRFGAVAALDGVDARFERGRIVAILGPNGAGKSTLLRTLIGALRPDAGTILIDGVETGALARAARVRCLGYVAQRPLLAGALSVREVVALGRFALDRSQERVERALAATELTREAERVASTLSLGQQQRVALARALAQVDAAGWLVLDEPLAALDPAHSVHAMALLRAHARGGGGVIATIHDPTSAALIADDALLLDRGRAVAAGPAPATLAPRMLEALYGVPFAQLDGDGLVALLPRPMHRSSQGGGSTS
ncbi:MAG TPA: ABC transporter ATP-binding protein [Phycisphaerales bacterium]|nr:ABC transporter ATP-binding protein [Phycisphaerales bacterium]HMP37490.1 ABC transporter ATP-binding protein [Phycisphaerales bacterium]